MMWLLLALSVFSIAAFAAQHFYWKKKIQEEFSNNEDALFSFEYLFNNTIESIIIFENDSCVAINESGVKLFGFENMEDALGCTLFDFIEADSLKLVKKHILSRSTEVYESEAIKQNETPFPVLVQNIYDDSQGSRKGIMSLIDISDLKEKEKDLKLEKLKVQESEKAKSNFIANMSHEIRTPMNGIIGMTHLLTQTTLDNQQKHYIRTIHSSSNSLLNIINDILDFSKIEDGELTIDETSFNLKELISDVAGVVQSKVHEKSLECQIHYADDLPIYLKGDRLRISQVLINLLNNAIKFTDDGFIRLDISNDGVRYKFKVIDTGIGMSEEQQQNLFKVFNQADTSTTRKYGGAGLGLSLSKNLARLMGGNIAIESVEHKGSTFTLEVKLSQVAQEDITKDRKLSIDDERSLKDSTILLVEDNKSNQEILVGLLKKSGIRIDIADNGQEALEMFQANKYALILMDIHMPIMDGFEATRRIREISQTIPIIALTADVMKEDIEETKKVGMNEYLHKPVEVDALCETLLKYITTNVKVEKKTEEKADIFQEEEPWATFNKFKYIDTEIGLLHLANDEQLYLKILDDFKNAYSGIKLEELESKEFKREMHTIKGLSATIGATALNLIVHELNSNEAAGLLPRFYEALNNVLSDLALVKQEKYEQKGSIEMTNIKRQELLGKFIAAVSTKKPKECAVVIAEVEEYELSEADLHKFIQVEKLVKKYKFKEALELLKDV